MEFHFRAGDERCPSTGAAATSANSKTAATRVHDGLVGGDGAGYHGKSSPPPASDPDELRRRAAKERIRERILREEAEATELEAEVRRELMEERAGWLARLAGRSEHRAAPAVASPKTAAPYFHESVQAGSKVDVSAAVPAKRKNPDVHDKSAVLAAPGSKKPKPGLTCTVCNITATSEVALQDHLSGKSHGKKAAKHALSLRGKGQTEEDTVPSECDMQSHLSGRKHTNKAKVAAVGVGACGNGSGSETVPMEANGVRRLDGGILQCELCDVKSPSECDMRTHLSGRKHTNKQKAVANAVKKAAATAATICSPSKEAASIVVHGCDDSVKKPAAGEMEVVVSSATPQVDVAAPVCARVSSVAPMDVDEGAKAADGTTKADEQERADPEEEEAVEIDGGAAVTIEEYNIQVEGKLFITLRQADGSLSCGLCGVHGCDKRGMINHLYTRDHRRRDRLAEEKKRASEAAQEAANKDGDGVPVTDGAAQVDN